MGWSAWGTNWDWQSKDTLNECVGALRERQNIQYLVQKALVVAGDDIQDVAFVHGLQTALEGMVEGWLDSSNYPDGWDGLAPPLVAFSEATWRAAAGLNADGFTRYTTHPHDAGEPAYGLVEAADVIGPWLFDELKAAVNEFIWTWSESLDWSGKAEENARDGDHTDAVWATAKAAVDTEFAAGTHHLDGPPSAYTVGSENGGFIAEVLRLYAHAEWVHAGGSALNRDVDFLAVGDVAQIDWGGTPPTGGVTDTFEANGDWPGGYTPGNFYQWLTDAGVTGASAYSSGHFGKSGAGDMPAWCAEPAEDEGETLGYTVTAGVAVMRWDVEDGLEFVKA